MIDSNVALDALPDDMRIFADAIAARHGSVYVMREKNGLHLYMACPACLEEYGRQELRKRHLSLNLSKRFGRDRWTRRIGTYDVDRICQCMKTQKAFSVPELLAWPTLEERGIKGAAGGVQVLAVERRCLIRDPHGNLIPDHPGDVIPVTQLQAGHPALAYLERRGIPVQRAYDQFRCGFCTREAPEDFRGMEKALEKNRWYRRLPGGFSDTPQGRLVFYADMFGVQQSWQARILDWEQDGTKYYLHPYTGQWVAMEQKGPDGKWHQILMTGEKKFDPQKYKNAFSSQKSEVIYGLDAAIRWNKDNNMKLAMPSEGPGDALRFGPPGIPLGGKTVSDTQVQLIRNHFDAVIPILQNDEHSRKMAAACGSAFMRDAVYFAIATPPPEFKDFGDMDDAAARAHLLKVNSNAPGWVKELLHKI